MSRKNGPARYGWSTTFMPRRNATLTAPGVCRQYASPITENSLRKLCCSCLGICCMLGPSSSDVSSPMRNHTPRPSLAGTMDAARACSGPGPIEATTAAFWPVTHRRAVAAWVASSSLRTPHVRSSPAFW